MFIGQRMEPGTVVFYSHDFGPPEGLHKKYFIVVEPTQVFYRVFAINTELTPWQKSTPERRKHVIDIDQASHKFLTYDSYINCSQLIPIRVQALEQYLRENAREKRGKINDKIRGKILEVIGDSGEYSEEDKLAIKKSLSRL